MILNESKDSNFKWIHIIMYSYKDCCTKQPESKRIEYVYMHYNKECNVHYTILDTFLGV